MSLSREPEWIKDAAFRQVCQLISHEELFSVAVDLCLATASLSSVARGYIFIIPA